MLEKTMKKLHQGAVSLTALAILGLAGGLHLPDKVEAAAGDFDVFPNNSRMSFLGRTANSTETKNIQGTSVLYLNIGTEGNRREATFSAELVSGDTIYFLGNENASGETINKQYTIATTNVTLPRDQVALTETLRATTSDDIIYSRMTGEIAFKYYPETDKSVGPIVLYVPAGDNTSASNDGVPDRGGFDFNGITATNLTCPDGFTPTVAPSSTSGIQIGNAVYHAFTCTPQSGASYGSGAFEIKITGLINPAPINQESNDYYTYDGTKVTACQNENGGNDPTCAGMMNSYGFRINQLDANNVWVRGTNTYVAYSNAVKMTVRVMPQLTFEIAGVDGDDAAAASVCGFTAGTRDTDAFTVDFGAIGNTYFTDAVQKLSVKTNAAHGYVVSARADDQMHFMPQNGTSVTCLEDGNTANCIPGVPTNRGNNVDKLTAQSWTVSDGRGFGYSVEIKSGDNYLNNITNVTVPSSYGIVKTAAAGKAPTGEVKWRSFADKENGDDPIQIFSNTRSTNLDEVYVCYRIMSSVDNVPGDYQTNVVYTVTATF